MSNLESSSWTERNSILKETESHNITRPQKTWHIDWQPTSRKEQLFFEVPQIFLVLLVLGLSLWLNPDRRQYGTHEQLGLSPCPVMERFGVPCPSCGLTTSFTLMARGRILQSFDAHYCGPFVFLGAIAYGGLMVTFLIKRKRPIIYWPWWVPVGLLGTALFGYLICWLIRLGRYW